MALDHGPKNISFPLFAPILSILEKGRTTVEWTWWRHRNAKIKGLSPPKFISKLGPWP